jgi:hypothetical protein
MSPVRRAYHDYGGMTPISHVFCRVGCFCRSSLTREILKLFTSEQVKTENGVSERGTGEKIQHDNADQGQFVQVSYGADFGSSRNKRAGIPLCGSERKRQRCRR